MARRNHLTLILISAVAAFFLLSWKFSLPRTGNLSLSSQSSSSSRGAPGSGSGSGDGNLGVGKTYSPSDPSGHQKSGTEPDPKTESDLKTKPKTKPQTNPERSPETSPDISPATSPETKTNQELSPATGPSSSLVLDSAVDLSGNILTGGAIAPRLGNETLKAELGRASWKLFHTMMARFPEEPSADDSAALKAYIALFARLYPCGECAGHFQLLLQKFPPQVSGRTAAAGWACHVHNQVNKRLEKDIFDCGKIGDFYDCGCGEDKVEGEKAVEGENKGPEGNKGKHGAKAEKPPGENGLKPSSGDSTKMSLELERNV